LTKKNVTNKYTDLRTVYMSETEASAKFGIFAAMAETADTVSRCGGEGVLS
jgi:hypothetical protein